MLTFFFFFFLQLITSNTLPTTPEVNEENSSKIGPPVKEKPPPGNGVFSPCLKFRLCCTSHRRRSVVDITCEYFYKKNPIYENDEGASRVSLSRQFLFRHSSLHSFKYVELHESPYVLHSQERPANGRLSHGVGIERSQGRYYQKPPSGIRTRAEKMVRKRRNLYEYPEAYYETILKRLDDEARWRKP